MDNTENYYQPSGYLPPGALRRMIVSAMILAPFLGFVHGLITHWLDIFITFFGGPIIMGVAMAGGSLLTRASRKARNRNDTATFCTGLFFGSLVWYCSWVAWIHAETGQLIANPSGLLDRLESLTREGTFILPSGRHKIVPYTPTGNVLYIVWLVEAVAIIVGTALAALFKNIESPYCEGCDQWATEKNQLPTLEDIQVDDKLALVSSLESGELEELQGVRPVRDEEDPELLEFTLRWCPSCAGCYYLSSRHLRNVNTPRGKYHSRTQIVTNLIINEAQVGLLKKRLNKTKSE